MKLKERRGVGVITTNEALDCLVELSRKLGIFDKCFRTSDNVKYIRALVEVAIPLVERRIKEEAIADNFIELGMPGPIMTKEMIETILYNSQSPNTTLNCEGKEI